MWAVPNPCALAHSNSKVYPMILFGGPAMKTSSFRYIRLLLKLCFNAFFAYVKLFESKRKQTCRCESYNSCDFVRARGDSWLQLCWDLESSFDLEQTLMWFHSLKKFSLKIMYSYCMCWTPPSSFFCTMICEKCLQRNSNEEILRDFWKNKNFCIHFMTALSISFNNHMTTLCALLRGLI